MDRSRFLAHLSGLGIPHESPLGEVARRYGVRRSRYYDWDVIYVSGTRPIVPGQVEPLNFQPRRQPDLLPPPDFFTFVSVDPDVRENHARALSHLTEWLGSPTDVSVSNTIGHQWELETAFVRLTSWPADRQSRMLGPNPAHERHPEMNAFAHLELAAGHVVPLASSEQEWVKSAKPLPSEGKANFERWEGPRRYASAQRGCIRRLPPELATRRKFIGISADSAALVGADGADAFILEKAQLVRLELARVAPAKGPGGSHLVAHYVDPFTTRDPERSKTVMQGPTQSTLDGVARDVAQWAEKDLSVSDYLDD